MFEIWKFPLECKTHIVLQMPAVHTILGLHVQVQVQGSPGDDDIEVPCIWAMCDTRSPTMPTHFTLYLTGEPLFETCVGRYIGTFLLKSRRLVGHIFKNNE